MRYFGSWAGKPQQEISHSLTHASIHRASVAVVSRRAAGYILCSLQRRFFTRRELAAYLTQPLLAAAVRQIIRSRPIKGSRRAACTRISAVHLFSRVMELSYVWWHAILRLCRMRSFAAALAHACNLSLIVAAELHHALLSMFGKKNRTTKHWFSGLKFRLVETADYHGVIIHEDYERRKDRRGESWNFIRCRRALRFEVDNLKRRSKKRDYREFAEVGSQIEH